MSRRWTARKAFKVDGVWYQVVEGVKSADDLRMDILVPTMGLDGLYGRKWQPIHMSHSAIVADFLYDNEEVLFPRGVGNNLGGVKHRNHLRLSEEEGWEAAMKKLRGEQARRRARV